VNSVYGLWQGSGVLVGPNLVLTAGHVPPWNDGPTTWSMEFIPAYRRNDPSNPEPYGRSFVETFRGYKPPEPFEPTGYDYALLKLAQPLGNALGWMGVQWSPNENWYLGRDHNSSGYPGTFSGRQAVQYGLRIVDIDNDLPGIELETVTYASGGWSGGPLWYYDGANPMIVGTVSGFETDVLDPQRDVHSGYKAMVDLVQFGLDNWQP
jgi:V8-like Glu-specific endopeptidase